MSEPTYENLGDRGYTIIPNVLSNEKIEELKSSIIHQTVDMIFTRQGYEVDPDDPETLDMMMDCKLRERILGEGGKNAPWRKGNCRDPIISKSCGMIDIRYNPELLELITFNPELYEIVKEIHGYKNLALIAGPERICIKPKGATDMPQHIDSNLFYDDVNYKFRIQGLVTLQIDEEINPRDSGTLCVIPYFQLFWDFARELFNPVGKGLELERFPDIPESEKLGNKSRFFILPTGKLGFDKYFLPELKKWAKKYCEYLKNTNVEVFGKEFFDYLQEKGISVPEEYISELKWTPVKLAPGDLVLWHQYLPHRSLRNKSQTPRICAYYNVFPVEKDWFGTEHQKWVQKQFERCEFYYGVDADKFPCKVVNVEELELLEEDPEELERRVEISQRTVLSRRLSGQGDWFEQEYARDEEGYVIVKLV